MVLTTFERLKEREIKKFILSIQEELKLIKKDIDKIKSENIPENVKIRLKKIEVISMGVEEQIVNLEDRMRAIETSFQNLEAIVVEGNANIDVKLTAIDDEIIVVKAQFNESLQELDDKKEDKTIEPIEEVIT